MLNDQKLEETISEYAELAKDKNIDVAMLMANALQQNEANRINGKTKRWLYLISVGVPPLGLFIGAYYFLSDKEDACSTAIVCIALTVFSILMTYLLFNTILSGSGTNIDQIKQIKPDDIYQLSQ